ncbi:hypothetical protein PFICI_08220 [Pestalotiopsis fici W106-1]|uniref:Uncharacterized protein n=1 Tax=Pestalotiopsis fici (strain W106-1 / CGMCC3.15140) TaxID=1229662 RepID=W3X693_PESFW|nr:uncharacterized protein PFICI_08220 [Pestalotiopsis fici W106-1]ETS80691.1 hypothetical protein PFICI_08220 [Pestalotiopsis fici W106-1]
MSGDNPEGQVIVHGPEGLSDDQLAEARRIWDEAKSMAPRSSRKLWKNIQAYDKKGFQEFLRAVFKHHGVEWNSLRRPRHMYSFRAKTVDMFTLPVGTWKKDLIPKAVTKAAGDVTYKIAAHRRKGATALCRPVIDGDTIAFKIIDSHAHPHSHDDVLWSGDGLSAELKAWICLHHDEEEFRHISEWNVRAAVIRFQYYLWKLNVSEKAARDVQVPEVKQMYLCVPIFENMYRDAKVVRQLAKEKRRRDRALYGL